eukprot:jgi/Bigna1/64237/fgenesh1_kg.70_\
MTIQHIRLSPVPSFGITGDCDPHFLVYRDGEEDELLYDSSTAESERKRYSKKADATVELLCNIKLEGDTKFVFYHRNLPKDTDHSLNSSPDSIRVFSFWIHASFIENDYLTLGREDLDNARNVSSPPQFKRKFDDEFKCELFFFPDNSDIRSIVKQQQQ